MPLLKKRLPAKRINASALITTLFVLVVLSTITVAFISSMNIERRITKAMQNKFQADLAADAGMQDFLSRLENIKTDGPYSTFYVLGPNTNPYLFLGKRLFSSTETTTKRIPLFSTGITNFDTLTNFNSPFLSATAQAMEDIDRSGLPVSRSLAVSNDIWCDINKTNSQFPSGIVGLRTTYTNTNAIPRLPANWIYIKNAAGKVIGRYAYWTDDECSKLDIRHAGNSENISGNHSRFEGSNPSELSLLTLTNIPGAVTNLTINNLPNILAFSNANFSDLPLNPSNLQYPLVQGLSGIGTNQWMYLKPYITTFSRHDDRSPDGKRRLNLNSVITSTTDATEIRRQTFAIRDAITNNLSTFGERFYSAANGTFTTPNETHQKYYVTRIAANIRDFIDTDSQATMILSDDFAYGGNACSFMAFDPTVLQDSDLPVAFGKESGLHLSEYARVVRVVNQSNNAHPASSATPVTIQVRFGHYIELCNISGKTISTSDLGTDPHIILGGRGNWVNSFPASSGGTPERLRLSEVKMRLPSDLAVPPGGHVYFTTDGGPFPCDSQSKLLGASASNRHQLTFGTNAGQWNLINTNGNTPASTSAGFEDYFITTRATNSGASMRYAVYNSELLAAPSYPDQRERLILANSNGIIDCAFRIFSTLRQFVMRNAQNPVWCTTGLGDAESETLNNVPGNPNDPRFSRGDLRSNFEIVSVVKKSTSQSWKNSDDGTGSSLNSSSQMTLGAENYKYNLRPTYSGNSMWQKGLYEHTTDPAGNAYFKNTNLTSLAELGGIYDPVRHDIEGYRSMGATLRVGQSDSPTNNRATNSGADFQNWLGGRGHDNPTHANFSKNAFLLMDIFRTDTNTSGRINPSSVVRDGSGIVLRSALTNFIFEGNPSKRASLLLGNQTLNTTNTIAAIRDFAADSSNGFLLSVGDLSRITAFWSTQNSTNNIVPGKVPSAASDSGKEEFLRRTANLLTTQSLAYTVYIVGQAGEFITKNGADTFAPTATTTTENVIQLEPVYPSSPDETAIAPVGWKTLRPKSLSY